MRRGHVTATLLCVSSKMHTRQWFVTNIGCVDTTVYTEVFTIFSPDMNFAKCLVTCPFLLWSLYALAIAYSPTSQRLQSLCLLLQIIVDESPFVNNLEKHQSSVAHKSSMARWDSFNQSGTNCC